MATTLPTWVIRSWMRSMILVLILILSKTINSTNKKIIALLPGSRKQEVTGTLDTMLSIQASFPEYEFVIAAVKSLPGSLYEKYQNLPNVTVVFEATYDLLSVAQAALVTSGTATLETALFSVPEVVCYRTSGVSYAIAKSSDPGTLHFAGQPDHGKRSPFGN